MDILSSLSQNFPSLQQHLLPSFLPDDRPPFPISFSHSSGPSGAGSGPKQPFRRLVLGLPAEGEDAPGEDGGQLAQQRPCPEPAEGPPVRRPAVPRTQDLRVYLPRLP